MDSTDFMIWLIVAAFLFILYIFMNYSYDADNQDFEKFKVTHHCKLVAHIEGVREVYYLMHNEDEWLCDDGATYYRDA